MIEKGSLTSTDNQIDTTTGTIKFRATFNNKANDLFPNQFVNARLLVRTLTNAVLVPTAAVQHNGTAAFVYIINESAGGKPSTNQAKSAPKTTVGVQPITVVTSNEKQSAVEGLNSGVKLATSGFDRLENNAEVRVTSPAQAAKSGQSTTVKPSGNSAP
jgi:multidrug efflux system membrane fusion protein